MMRSVISCCYN